MQRQAVRVQGLLSRFDRLRFRGTLGLLVTAAADLGWTVIPPDDDEHVDSVAGS